MKWPFFKNWLDENGRCSSTEVKRKQKRQTKTRLVNLLCATKQRPFSKDLSVNGFQSKLKPKPPLCKKKNETDYVDSPSPLVRRPLPPLVRTSTATKRPAATNHSPSAFCPTCNQVMILLPQKRSTQVNEPYSFEPQVAKRMRSSFASYQWEPVKFNNGQLNPTYEDLAQSKNLRSDYEDSIYSEVASISSSNSSKFDISRRPKLVGIRRRDSLKRFNPFNINQWFVGESSINELVQSEPIYATVLPDDSEYDDDEFTISSSSSRESVFEQPWSCSTLKSSGRLQENTSIYDTVASDDEENDVERDLKSTDSVDSFRAQSLDKTRRRRQVQEYGDYHIKRARREYYICEE